MIYDQFKGYAPQDWSRKFENLEFYAKAPNITFWAKHEVVYCYEFLMYFFFDFENSFNLLEHVWVVVRDLNVLITVVK